MNENKNEKEEGVAGTFLLGLALGALLGVLFAPAKGSDTRQNLSDLLGNLIKEHKDEENTSASDAGESQRKE